VRESFFCFVQFRASSSSAFVSALFHHCLALGVSIQKRTRRNIRNRIQRKASLVHYKKRKRERRTAPRKSRRHRSSHSRSSHHHLETTTLLLGPGRRLEDVRVSRVRDGEHAHAVQLSAGGAELDVVCLLLGVFGVGVEEEKKQKVEEVSERKNTRREGFSFFSPNPTKKRSKNFTILTASVVVHARLREHRVVLDLRLAHGRAVVRDDHKLALAAAQALESGLEAERELARLDDERQPGVDVLLGLFLLREC